jgi:hypothetical protein
VAIEHNIFMLELEKTGSGTGWPRRKTNTESDRPAAPHLERLYSGQHLDDHSYYHHSDHQDHVDDDDGQSSLAKGDIAEGHNGDGEKDEVGASLPDIRDLESKRSPLEKRITTRSVKPENLVGITLFDS